VINIAAGVQVAIFFAISIFARLKKWAMKRPKLQHTYKLADYTKFYLQNATQVFRVMTSWLFS
jgi:hypothetical protein